MPTFAPEPLNDFAREVFIRAGVPADEAAVVAKSLVASNLAGHDSHGVIRVAQYLKAMDDGINRGDETDRIMVSWALAAPPVPTPEDDRVVASVAVPHDIESLRRTDPADAAAWRVRVRDEIMRNIADGLRIGGFDDERGYLFVARR